MKKYFTLASALCFFAVNAQNVGINTTSPSATLDVNGNVKIRTVAAADAANTYDYLVVDPATDEVQKVNGNFGRNLSIAKAVNTDGFALLGTALFGGYTQINFEPTGVNINPGSYFDASTDFYTVPSSGIYEINYYVRYGTGIQASILGGSVKIGILKTDLSAVSSTLDERAFAGANITVPIGGSLPLVGNIGSALSGLASITITSAEINSIYQLTAGDKISFAIDKGGVALSLLGSSRADFVIKKISN